MKKTFFIAASYALMTSCTNDAQQPIQHTSTTGPKIVVAQVVDYSLSVDGINYFDSSAAQNLVSHLAATSGGVIKLVGIYENSTKQNVFTLHVERQPDTVSEQNEDNIYKKSHQRTANQKVFAQYNERLQQQISLYTAVALKPRTEQYTDLSHALALAATTLNEPTFSHYKRYLLLQSDCLEDIPGKSPGVLVPLELKKHNSIGNTSRTIC